MTTDRDELDTLEALDREADDLADEYAKALMHDAPPDAPADCRRRVTRFERQRERVRASNISIAIFVT